MLAEYALTRSEERRVGKEKPSWVKMCRILNMSQPDYYRKRNKALFELAYNWGIEVEEN